MRHPDNIAAVAALGIDMMGFICYPRSPRYIGEEQLPITPQGIERVGVFVNASYEEVVTMAEKQHFTTLQLHGSESPQLCKALREQGYQVIKAIPIDSIDSLAAATAYLDVVDYLLFDTKCPQHGGCGVRFDWQILDSYKGTTPFLLSGGISPTVAAEIATLQHPMLAGVDLNSQFEVEPARKNVTLLENFIAQLR